jgi:hypothetical protein
MQKTNAPASDPASTINLIAAWLLVGIPLVWGVYKTAVNVSALFK